MPQLRPQIRTPHSRQPGVLGVHKRKDSARILIWDIEATNLNASIGSIVCIGYKWYGEEKTTILSIRSFPNWDNDPTDDKALVKEFAEIYISASMLVTWYGKRFDLPFVQTRLLSHNLNPLPVIPHFDGWETARKKLKFHSNRLATVQDFLELPSAKTPLSFRALSRCMAGHLPSLQEVEHHCKMDVIVLEQAYDRLKAFGGDFHPNRSILGGSRDCPTCDSGHVQSRGCAIAISRAYKRYQCQACGRWFRETKPMIDNQAEVR